MSVQLQKRLNSAVGMNQYQQQMNKHRFWKQSIAVVLVLSSCFASPESHLDSNLVLDRTLRFAPQATPFYPLRPHSKQEEWPLFNIKLSNSGAASLSLNPSVLEEGRSGRPIDGGSRSPSRSSTPNTVKSPLKNGFIDDNLGEDGDEDTEFLPKALPLSSLSPDENNDETLPIVPIPSPVHGPSIATKTSVAPITKPTLVKTRGRLGPAKSMKPSPPPPVDPKAPLRPINPTPLGGSDSSHPTVPTLQPHPLPILHRNKLNPMQSACKSGTFRFDPSRVYLTRENEHPPEDLDPTRWDWIIDYNSQNVAFDGKGGIQLQLTRPHLPHSPAIGTRISSVRYINNARITASVQPASNVPGIVTSFITMSKGGDEVDLEWVGRNAGKEVQTNVFYRGIKEYDPSHSDTHKLTTFEGVEKRNYTLDWTDKSISWVVGGVVVRSVTPGSERSNAVQSPQVWYPTEPAQVQFGIWDAGFVDPSNPSATSGTSVWAGGPIPWKAEDESSSTYSALIESMTVQCYDPVSGQPVDAYPVYVEDLQQSVLKDSENRAAIVAVSRAGMVIMTLLFFILSLV